MTMLTTPFFEQYTAKQTAAGQPIIFDEMIFANIEGLTAESLPLHLEMPKGTQIVYRADITRASYINENKVVYSVMLGSDIGDFEFNFIGLTNKAENQVAVVLFTDLISKKKSSDRSCGNAITRNLILNFRGAKELTHITIPAQSWQLDFTGGLLELRHQINEVTDGLEKFKMDVSHPDGFRFIGQAESIAQLRTIEPTEDQQRILLNSWHSGKNLGGGEFYADLSDDTTPDNSGTVIVTAGGKRWKRVDTSHLTLFDFGAIGDGVANDELALQNALHHPQFFIENGIFRINSPVYSVRDNVKILGNKTGKLVLGAEVTKAGAEVFTITHSHYAISGFCIETPNKSIGIRFKPMNAQGVKHLFVDNITFQGTFYGVRAGESISASTGFTTENVAVQYCQSYCGAGSAGHYLCTNVKGVHYFNNIAVRGRNVSAYGATSCADIFIFGNREQGMAVTSVDVEAGIQIEDVQSGECVVANNICSHDIWMSGAKNALVNNNHCRRLRLTSGNPADTGSYNVEFVHNHAQSIVVAKYGRVENPELFIDEVRFLHNTLNPVGANQEVYIDGSILKRAQFVGNRTLGEAKQHSVRMARNHTALHLTFMENHFSSKPAYVTGKQGLLFCNDTTFGLNKNRLKLRVSTAEMLTVNSQWQKLPFNRVTNDVNGHIEIGSGQFIAKTAGIFRLKGKLTLTNSSEAILNMFQVRLTVNSTEVERLVNQGVLAKNRQTNTNGMTTVHFDALFNLNVGDVVELQYKTTHELKLISESFLTQVFVTQEL